MKTAAVIAEYNPFHRGHEYQLRRIRHDSGADFILVIMSGDFVQRGAPAVLDKYARTRAALLGGADLVLELPVFAALGSARDFGGTAVRILDRLGVVDELWFGSESEDLAALQSAARILTREPGPYRTILTQCLSEGLSYPAAQSRAVQAVFSESGGRPEKMREVLSSPNDLLALSYLSALVRCGSSITPKALGRKRGDHHSDGGTAWSAEAVRNHLARGWFCRAVRALPENSASMLIAAADRGTLLVPDDFSEQILFLIRRGSAESLTEYAGINPDLAHRIKKLCCSYHSVSSFADALKTKNITRTRIDRALFSVLLGIRKGDAARAADFSSVRILGFRRGAEHLLGEIAEKGSVRAVAGAKNMPEEEYRTDCFASGLCEAVRAKKSGSQFHHEFAQNLVIL